MSTWGCHAAMLRTLERQPPADEALVGPQASVVGARSSRGRASSSRPVY